MGLFDSNAPDPQAEKVKALRILMANANKNFVQRVLYPQGFPVMNLPNGDVATHQMAWGEIDGKPAVYPTIIFKGGGLLDLGPDAEDYAKKSGEYIQFKNKQEADWFSKRYKAAWE